VPGGPGERDGAEAAAGKDATATDGFIGTAVARIVESPAMATVWVTALRTAHAGVPRTRRRLWSH
jgi:hypothetical protein